MRENWKTIQFEDCIERVPKTTKIQSSEYQQSGTYPIVSQEDSIISGFWDNSADVLQIAHPVVVFGDHTRILKYIDFDFVVGADGVKVLSPKPFLCPKFLYYYLRWVNIPSLGYSRHYKLLKELTIPVPPIVEQERIVGELDLLSGIIDKQKAQLRELDTLAQSIFYDMFGDPIINEKDWVIRLLGEVCTIGSGGTPSKKVKEFWEGGYIPWIGSHMCQNKIIYETDGNFITQMGLDNSSAKMLPIDTIIIALVGATIGKVGLLKIECCTNQNIAFVMVSNAINCYFLYYVIINLYKLFLNIGNGKFKMANLAFVRNLPIIQPPLILQQRFAERIENIERQKELIKQSISDTETLYNSRMDYYFD